MRFTLALFSLVLLVAASGCSSAAPREVISDAEVPAGPAQPLVEALSTARHRHPSGLSRASERAKTAMLDQCTGIDQRLSEAEIEHVLNIVEGGLIASERKLDLARDSHQVDPNQQNLIDLLEATMEELRHRKRLEAFYEGSYAVLPFEDAPGLTVYTFRDCLAFYLAPLKNRQVVVFIDNARFSPQGRAQSELVNARAVLMTEREVPQDNE